MKTTYSLLHLCRIIGAILFGIAVSLFLSAAAPVYGQLPKPPSPDDIISPTKQFICDTEADATDVTGISFPTPDCDGGGGSTSGGGSSSGGGDDSSSGGGASSSSGGGDDSSSSGGGSSSGGSSSGGSSSGGGSSSSGGGSSSGGSGGGGGGGGSRKSSSDGPEGVQALELGGTCEEYIQEFVRFGISNNPEEVLKLQQFLRDEEGFENVLITGVYDESSRDAVLAFQRRYASDILGPWGILDPTGYVYLTTRKKINELHCQNERQFGLTSEQLAEIEKAKTILAGQGFQEVIPETLEIGVGETGGGFANASAGASEGEEIPDEGGAGTEEELQVATARAVESSFGKFFRSISNMVGRAFQSVF